MNQKESNIIDELKSRGYDEDPRAEGEGGYDYLLRMQVRTFTADKVRQLKNDIASTKEKLDGLRVTTEQEIWIRELDEFEVEYRKWLQDIEKDSNSNKKQRVKK